MKLALLDPLVMESGETGLKVTVPADELANVTDRVASAVLGFPKASRRWIVMELDAWAAATDTGEVVNANWLAVPGTTVRDELAKPVSKSSVAVMVVASAFFRVVATLAAWPFANVTAVV